MTLSTLTRCLCPHVKRIELVAKYKYRSLLTFFSSFVAYLIIHSKVVPIVEVPLFDMEDRKGRDEYVNYVFAFVFLYPSPFLSEQFHFHVSDLCREIRESLLMGYFFCSPHEQQHVKVRIKTNPNACWGNKLGLVAILQKRAFPSLF